MNPEKNWGLHVQNACCSAPSPDNTLSCYTLTFLLAIAVLLSVFIRCTHNTCVHTWQICILIVIMHIVSSTGKVGSCGTKVHSLPVVSSDTQNHSSLLPLPHSKTLLSLSLCLFFITSFLSPYMLGAFLSTPALILISSFPLAICHAVSLCTQRSTNIQMDILSLPLSMWQQQQEEWGV